MEEEEEEEEEEGSGKKLDLGRERKQLAESERGDIVSVCAISADRCCCMQLNKTYITPSPSDQGRQEE